MKKFQRVEYDESKSSMKLTMENRLDGLWLETSQPSDVGDSSIVVGEEDPVGKALIINALAAPPVATFVLVRGGSEKRNRNNQ